MRVGLLANSLECGGVETFLLQLYRWLADRGFYVELVTTERRGEWFDFFRNCGCICTHVPCGARNPVVRSWRVMREVIRKDFDILLLNHVPAVQAALAMLPERAIAIPVIHNHLQDIYDVGCFNPRAWNVAVGVSPRVVAETRRRVGPRPVLHVPCGVAGPPDHVLSGRAPIQKALRLLYLGRLDEAQKRVLLLPEILRACLARNIDATLTIAGDGPERNEFEARIAAYGLRSRTTLLGRVDPKDAYRILLQSHVLLLTSRFEGLPIVLLEAQACGCVPVCSLLEGMTDAAVDNGKTGLLVSPEGIAGYVDAIQALAGNEAVWTAMSLAAIERARELFSVVKMCEAYERILTDALSGAYPLPLPRRLQPPVNPLLYGWRPYVGPIRRAVARLRRGRGLPIPNQQTGKEPDPLARAREETVARRS